jgi:glycosyltransferase involved in cell wall biosynthesis
MPLLQRLTYHRAPFLAVVSRDVGSELVAAHGGRISEKELFILHNPVDSEEVRRLSSPTAPRNGKFRLCAIGRLAPEKGYDILITALKQANGQLGDWELIVMGDGPRRGELERLSAALGLTDAVHFVGNRKNPFPVLGSADVFVHPARWEGFGLVLGEALSLGIPIIATNAPGGVREILAEGKFGLMVPPEDPDSLAQALVQFASSPSFRANYASHGPRRALEFSPERIARRILIMVDKSV